MKCPSVPRPLPEVLTEVSAVPGLEPQELAEDSEGGVLERLPAVESELELAEVLDMATAEPVVARRMVRLGLLAWLDQSDRALAPSGC